MIKLKTNKKQNIARVLFLLVLFFIGNYYLGNLINNKVNHEINNYTLTKVEILRSSGHWNLSPFVINDAPGSPNDWVWAETQPWCSGSGTFEDPYLIENVTIDGENSGSCLTIINSDKYFRIENCTVFNAGTATTDSGIYLISAGNGTLINNNCSFNYRYGIRIYLSDNTTVSGNIANNNSFGIYTQSSNNTISGNIAINNKFNGILISTSHNNTISGNTANNNSYGISITSNNNIVSRNTANNNKNHGINLVQSDYNTISGNTVKNNQDHGIRLLSSNSTTISGNIIDNNVNNGIVVTSNCEYNLIYKNHFINNGIHALDEGISNSWNSSITGNYWDNYTGSDANDDGIGDTPHNFGTGIDYLPIWNFQSPIHIDDSATGVGAHNWTWAETQPWCSGSGTFSDQYIIDGLNITARGVGNGILIGNSSKYFIVRNCKIIESGSINYDAGIHLDHAGNGTLINNNCTFNKLATYLYYSDNTTVLGNTANYNDYGIYISYSDNTTVSGNTAYNNQEIGIYLYASNNNTVSGNTAYNNQKIGIYIVSDNTTVSGNTANNNNMYGIYLLASDNNTVSGNTANNNSIHGIFILTSHNNNVSRNTANNNTNYGIRLSSSDNNTVSGNTANNNSIHGIYISYSDNTTVSGNTANNNQDDGIRLYRSGSTTISGNIVDNNVNYGIYTEESDYSLIYKNYFLNNGLHALDSGSFNNWNSSIVGNYWDNYAGYDDDFDGIGDSSHNFGTGIDYLPIWTFQSPIHIDDSATGVGAHNWTWAETQPWCSGSGTFSTPYIIDGLNITARGVGDGILIENSYKYFKVRNCKLIESGSGTYDAGIHLDHVGNGTLINNNCSLNNNAGIILYHSCFNNTISGNYFTQNIFISIWLRYSDNNKILDNKIINNVDNGVHLYNCNNNTIDDNEIINNDLGIRIHVSYDNNVTNNDLFDNGFGISLRYGHNAKIFLNNISGNNYGFFIDNTRYCDIHENTIENSVNDGIWINDVSADNNTIYDNDINSNARYGIFIQDSGCQDNEIYLNNFNDNNFNAYDNGTDNEWDNGVIGNFWDDYAGVDANDDGIGDTPYIISGTAGSQDNYPIWADGDDITPVITIVLPLANGVFGLDAPSFQIIIVELNLDTIWYTLDGGGTNYTITGLTGTFNQLAWGALSEDNITIKFYANDTAGHIGSAAVTVEKDISAPVITIISPLPNSIIGLDAPNYNISIDQLNLDTIWYTLDGGITNYTITDLTGTFNHLAWEALSEGSLTIRFYANDTAGNIGSAAVTVEKDVSAPVITIIFPLPDSVFDLVTPNYNISIDELNLDTIWYTLDGGGTNYTITGFTGIFNQATWEALSEGSVTIRFYANDTSGNIGFVDVEVIIEVEEIVPFPILIPIIIGISIGGALGVAAIFIFLRKRKLGKGVVGEETINP